MARPIRPPKTICITTSRTIRHHEVGAGAMRLDVRSTVRITATGSLIPDSTSSVPPTRRLRWIPLLRSTEYTAAASVDDTTDPKRSATDHGTPNALANAARRAAVPTTPSEASVALG